MAGNKVLTNLLFNIETNTAELKKGLEQANNHIRGFKKQAESAGSALKGIFALNIAQTAMQAGRAIYDFGKEAANAAAQAEGIKIAFDRLNQPDLLNKMRDAVKGTVSDVDLMKAAVKASEFNIPIEKMAVMMEFAAVQAGKLGESTDYMVESIVTGLARGSVQILDNLGLSAKDLSEKAKTTGDVSSAAFELMQEKLTATGGLIETTATRQARWSAMIENTKISFGNLINQGINLVTPAFLDALDGLKSFWNNSKKYLVDLTNGWIELYNESLAFRLVVEYIKFGFASTYEAIRIMLRNLVDSFQNAGKILGYVLNPKNWGAGFSLGLAVLVKDAFNDFKENIVDYGENIADNFIKGLNSVKKGKIELISTEQVEEAAKTAANTFTKKFADTSGVGGKSKLNQLKTIGFSQLAKTNVDTKTLAISKSTAKNNSDSFNYWNNLLNIYNEKLNAATIGSDEFNTIQSKILSVQDYLNKTSQTFTDKLYGVNDALGAVNSIGNDVSNVIGMLFGDESQKKLSGFIAGIQGFISGFQSLISIITTINDLIGIFKSITDASIASTEALTIAKNTNNAATLAGAAASASEASADSIGAAAAAGKSAAKVPVIGAILAVAAIASVVGALIAARGKLKGKYMGGTGFGGGELTMVGEQGAELVTLPSGARVHSAGRTKQMLSNYQPQLQPIVLDTRIKGSDIYLTQRNYNETIVNTR